MIGIHEIGEDHRNNDQQNKQLLQNIYESNKYVYYASRSRVQLVFACTYDGGPYPDQGRAFFDRHFKICTGAH
jgi:hypothetical protein